MRLEVDITEQQLYDFTTGFVRRMEDIEQPVTAAMGEKFFEVVRMNFGDFGVDRPIAWAPLSPKYAKRVGREHSTLFVSGRLAGAVKFSSNAGGSTVSISSSDVPYALAQQYGYAESNLPARPYFPIDASGNILPYTEQLVIDAATAELERLVK